MYTYNQKTGEFSHSSVNAPLTHITTGYSGLGEGRNNPALQYTHDVGPIPTGQWKIGPAIIHPKLGPIAMSLSPCLGTHVNGRDGFYIHGDSRVHPGQASHGCIILDNSARQLVADSADKLLVVV